MDETIKKSMYKKFSKTHFFNEIGFKLIQSEDLSS